VLVRITRQPDDPSLTEYHVGCVYDLPAALADYLVLTGCGVVEMRRETRSRRTREDRRKRYWVTSK
jgi:hypothetical protein